MTSERAAPPPQVLTNAGGFSRDLSRPAAAPLNPRTLAAPVLRITENSIVGQGSEYSVRFASNLRTTGAVALRRGGRPALRSSISGLAYVDVDSGKTVLIAKVSSTPAQLLGTDSVLYADAFETDGAFVADVIFRCGVQSFEQDVVARSALPSPTLYGLEDPNRVELCVITEFFDGAKPGRRAQWLDLSEWNAALGTDVEPLLDEVLGFDGLRMHMIPGKAFSLDKVEETIPVRKEWQVTPDGSRRFLMEFTPYELLEPLQEALPRRHAALDRGTDGLFAFVSAEHTAASPMALVSRPERHGIP